MMGALDIQTKMSTFGPMLSLQILAVHLLATNQRQDRDSIRIGRVVPVPNKSP